MAKSTQKKKPKSSPTRAESVRAARARETPEERQAKAKAAASSGTPEERAERARRAGLASAAARAEKKRRSEAAREGWETRRREHPERYGPPKKTRKSDRSDAARKGWETRRREHPERYGPKKPPRQKATQEQLRARSLKSAATRRAELAWSSAWDTIVQRGRLNFGAFAAEVIDIAIGDAAAQGAKKPLARPWRVVIHVEGEAGGSASLDVTVDGTKHERAASIAVATAQAAKEAGAVDDPSPQGRGPTGRGGRAAAAMDEAARTAREAALREFGGGSTDAPARVSVLVAPAAGAVWRGIDAAAGAGDDLEDAPF